MTKFGPTVGESIAKALESGIASELPRRNAPVTNSRPRKREVQEQAAAADQAHADHVCFVVNVETPNWKNDRSRYRRSKLTALQRDLVKLLLSRESESTRQALALGCVVTLTRVAPRRLDEDDNLRVALSAFRDQIAVWLFGGRVGQRDNDKRMRVEYGQVRGHVPSVVVSIRETT